uniref:Uncharacterized protein n=1 Tax=Plectus sambesii TaxID=2011161 RepID=A0A914W5I7_9BILA
MSTERGRLGEGDDNDYRQGAPPAARLLSLVGQRRRLQNNNPSVKQLTSATLNKAQTPNRPDGGTARKQLQPRARTRGDESTADHADDCRRDRSCAPSTTTFLGGRRNESPVDAAACATTRPPPDLL